MKRILFVCLGNICRSAMAQYMMKHLVSQTGHPEQWVIDSCGTSNEEAGNPIYPPAKATLAKHGISSEGHRARQMTRADYTLYDHIIAMDRNNIRHLRRYYDDDPEEKISLLLDHLPADHPRHGCEVADPWYTGNFDVTYKDLLAGCTILLQSANDK